MDQENQLVENRSESKPEDEDVILLSHIKAAKIRRQEKKELKNRKAH